MRVAFVHDWLVAQRGGEHVLLELLRLFPQAPIYTLVHEPGSVHPDIARHPIHTSFIQRLPGAPKKFRRYLPFFPAAAEAWDLRAYDCIISTSHCVAKGVRVAPEQIHIAYIHTPMRYLWDQLPQYVPEVPARRMLTSAAQTAVWPLRRWDRQSAQRPTVLIANSHYVAERIERVWGRSADVLYPPVDVDFFRSTRTRRARAGYVVVSALVPYKRVDLAVRLATAKGLPLTVVGTGGELPRLQAMAGPTVQFVPHLDRERLRDLYSSAKALFFCGVEDFGIVPVEAMACGCPVIAYGCGGVTESVVDDGPQATGVFFTQPSVASMAEVLQRFETRLAAGAFQGAVLRARAAAFSRQRFVTGFADIAERVGVARAALPVHQTHPRATWVS